jgi:hypothetical protein
MKVVINDCFGGFSINAEIAMKYFGDKFFEPKRTNTTLINLIESGVNCNDSCSKLKVVDIPDNATDWRIIEYDGAEYVIYVIDGKMHSIY